MVALVGIFTVICSLVCLVWVSRHIMIITEKRSGFSLTEEFALADGPFPMISVLVAAKDEEENIETCVRTMLGQDYPNFELIVCNDRSSDRTAEIVAKIAKEDSRLKLITIERLPEGWGGKNNAMHTGIAQAKGEWICMIDADCRQTSPMTLRASMRYAHQTGSDLLSVLPTLEMRGFWENAVQPVCSGVMMIWFHPAKVNSPRHSNAYANGAFMLMKQSAYRAVGGHEAVRTCVNEDMHMAARVKGSGLKLQVVRNDGLYITRMYTSLPQIYRGWSRIFYGTFVTLRRIVLSLVALMTVSMLPYLAAAVGLTLAAIGVGPTDWLWGLGIAGSVAVSLQMTAIYRYYGLIGARRSLAWSYPIGCVVAMVALFTAISKLRKGAQIVWRNTSYAAAGQTASK